jgi:hypothetical protein
MSYSKHHASSQRSVRYSRSRASTGKESQELVFDADMRPYMLYVMKSASHCGKVELTRQNINHDSLRLPWFDANSQLRCSPSLVILEHRWKDSDKSRC